MQRIFSSPHIIDLVVALTVLEAIGLLLARRRFGDRTPGGCGGIRPIGIVLMLLPGLFLMLAVRAALDGAAWPWVPAALAAALVAHLADLRQRWVG